MASMSGNSGWAQLRQQARSLETQTEHLFHTYSQFSTTPNLPSQPTDEEKTTESKLQELLGKREGVIGQLARLLDSDSALTSSNLKQNNLSLLRERLSSHRGDLARLRSNIVTARDRANLLSSVRNDIESYRTTNPEAAEAEYMLEERQRIDHSHSMADSVLSQAYAVSESFVAQRESLQNISRRINLAAGKVPGLNTIIGKISARKSRDGIIMGTFIAFCFMMFWWLL